MPSACCWDLPYGPTYLTASPLCLSSCHEPSQPELEKEVGIFLNPRTVAEASMEENSVFSALSSLYIKKYKR